MKKNTHEVFTATLFALLLLTNNAFSQWGTNGNNIYNTNLGKLGVSPSGNFTSPSYQIDCKGDINLYNTTDALRLNGSIILWHNGNSQDIFVGKSAGNASMTGHFNTMIGYSAGVANTSGAYNVCVGSQAGAANTSGSRNTFVGHLSGYYNTTGSYNVFMGYDAGSGNTIGAQNTFSGYYSGANNTTASNNVALGFSALFTQSFGNTQYDSYNVAVGNYALYSNQPSVYDNGIKNTALGYKSGYSNTTGYNNLFLGCESGYYNSSAINNVFVGYRAGYGNQSGTENVFLGNLSGLGTSTGSYNVFMGNSTGGNCSSGSYNSFIGHGAGSGTSSGSGNVLMGYQARYTGNAANNTFTGYQSGYYNTSGGSNVAYGFRSLFSNTTGAYNTALGYQALYLTSGAGANNTAVGLNAGYSNTTGTNNTFIGFGANVSAGTYSNCAAIGNGATATATNMMYLGNANSLLYCALGWWTGSDGRFKTNVTENVKGLAFINKLRPVTYNMNTNMLDDFQIQNLSDSLKAIHKAGMDFTASTAVVHSGFIAQEVEAAGQQVGFNSSIVHSPDNNTTHYALNYAEIVVPLVKAVQELSKTIDSLKTAMNACCVIKTQRSTQISSESIIQTAAKQTDVELSNKNIVVLDQNVPNPFAEQTTINYFLPDNITHAQIIFLEQSGKLIKAVDLTEKGRGTLNVFANDLSSGIYT